MSSPCAEGGEVGTNTVLYLVVFLFLSPVCPRLLQAKARPKTGQDASGQGFATHPVVVGIVVVIAMTMRVARTLHSCLAVTIELV